MIPLPKENETERKARYKFIKKAIREAGKIKEAKE